MKTIRQQIIDDDGVRVLIAEIEAMPKRALEARGTLDRVQHELDMHEQDYAELEARKKTIEDEHYFLVREEKDEATNKNKYTNEEQRKSAVTLACRKDKEYAQVMTEILDHRKKRGELKMKVGMAINTLKYITGLDYGYGHVADIVAGLSRERVSGDLTNITKFAQQSKINGDDNGNSDPTDWR